MIMLKPIEKVLNLALAQDSETYARLHVFEQKCIVLEITDLHQSIAIHFLNNQLQLQRGEDEHADLHIAARSSALLQLAQHADNLFSSDIRIHGDVQFAKQLQDVMAGFDFDWEHQLARVTGDIIAQPLAFGLKQGFGWLKQTHQSFSQSLSEYLREEAQIVPDRIQIDDFLQHIDQLRADSDRLEARIQRLLQRQQPRSSS